VGGGAVGARRLNGMTDSMYFLPSKAGDMSAFVELFRIARAEGLGVTLHIAEVRVLAELGAVFPECVQKFEANEMTT
jgi:hypothetical protein